MNGNGATFTFSVPLSRKGTIVVLRTSNKLETTISNTNKDPVQAGLTTIYVTIIISCG